MKHYTRSEKTNASGKQIKAIKSYLKSKIFPVSKDGKDLSKMRETDFGLWYALIPDGYFIEIPGFGFHTIQLKYKGYLIKQGSKCHWRDFFDPEKGKNIARDRALEDLAVAMFNANDQEVKPILEKLVQDENRRRLKIEMKKRGIIAPPRQLPEVIELEGEKLIV